MKLVLDGGSGRQWAPIENVPATGVRIAGPDHSRSVLAFRLRGKLERFPVFSPV
jgi:hypothetical protein